MPSVILDSLILITFCKMFILEDRFRRHLFCSKRQLNLYVPTATAISRLNLTKTASTLGRLISMQQWGVDSNVQDHPYDQQYNSVKRSQYSQEVKCQSCTIQMTTVNSTCKSYGDKRNICSANCRANDATEGQRYNFRICAEVTELLEMNQKHRREDDFSKQLILFP